MKWSTATTIMVSVFLICITAKGITNKIVNAETVIQNIYPNGNIGYIDCMKEGIGPWHLCNGMDIRCFTERGGEQIECPTFENVFPQ